MAFNKYYYLISFSCTLLKNFNLLYSWALQNLMQKRPVFMQISWKNSDLNFVFMRNFVQSWFLIDTKMMRNRLFHGNPIPHTVQSSSALEAIHLGSAIDSVRRWEQISAGIRFIKSPKRKKPGFSSSGRRTNILSMSSADTSDPL